MTKLILLCQNSSGETNKLAEFELPETAPSQTISPAQTPDPELLARLTEYKRPRGIPGRRVKVVAIDQAQYDRYLQSLPPGASKPAPVQVGQEFASANHASKTLGYCLPNVYQGLQAARRKEENRLKADPAAIPGPAAACFRGVWLAYV